MSARRWLVCNQSEKEAEILIQGIIGKDWWDDSGTSAKEFNDALEQIPAGKPITIGINSEGGSIKDGFGIYNAIKRRGDSVTCRIDGYALSIASIIALAGHRTVCPKSAIWMIHEPWSFTQGNAQDHFKAAVMLEEHANALAEIYTTETGKDKEEIRKAMQSETWIRGSEAVEWGLADALTDEQAALNAYTPDFTHFRATPKNILTEALGGQVTPIMATSSQTETSSSNASVTISAQVGGSIKAENATTAQTERHITMTKLLAALVEAKLITSAEAPEDELLTQFQTSFDAMSSEVKRLQDVAASEKLQRITAEVDAGVAANRITKEERETWIKALSSDNSDIRSAWSLMPTRTVGAPPVPQAAAEPSQPKQELTGLARAIAAHKASKA